MVPQIDISVGGKFEAEWMALALVESSSSEGEISLGRLFSSYPASKFPRIPARFVHSVLLPEILFRGFRAMGFENQGDLAKMALFDRMVARERTKVPSDLFVGWSSFSLENLRRKISPVSIIVRDSAHILTQSEILRAEFAKWGERYPNRSACEERELEEYDLCSHILVPSQFVKRTFLERGISESKVVVLPLGVDPSVFQPGSPPPNGRLRVVYFGQLSLRKGVQYLLEAMASLSDKGFECTLIGKVASEFGAIMQKYRPRHFDSMPQSALAGMLKNTDVFVFPTLEDGFGMTLFQAMAVGVVPIVTSRCGAAEWVTDGINGFIIPPNDSLAIREKLELLADDRDRLQTMRVEAMKITKRFSWDEYQANFRSLVASCCGPQLKTKWG